MIVTIEWWHGLIALGGCAALGFGVYGFALWYTFTRGFGR